MRRGDKVVVDHIKGSDTLGYYNKYLNRPAVIVEVYESQCKLDISGEIYWWFDELKLIEEDKEDLFE